MHNESTSSINDEKQTKNENISEETEGKAKFREIERSSMLLSLFSRLDETTGSFLNTPYILGGQGYLKDEKAKDSVEHAFGQLNLPDLFQQFEFVLNVAFYMPIKIKEDLKISPNFYIVKTKYETSIFGMYLILSPYSDLNITALNRDLMDLVTDYAGVAIRTSMQKEKEGKKSLLLSSQIHPDIEKATGLLLQRIYYRLFLERKLSGGPEKPTKAANLVAIMIQEATVNQGYINLEENRVYALKKGETMESVTTSENIRPAPPVMSIDTVSFLFPSSLQTDFSDYHSPIDVRYLFQASNMPTDLNFAYFRLDPNLFQFIMPIPAKSIFEYRNTEDIISLFTHHREYREDNGQLKTQIVTGISDSKIEGPDFMSEMAMRIVVRDIEEGFMKNFTLEKILKRITVLQAWNHSIEYSVKGETTPEDLLSWKNIKIREN
ncbi:MAG: hypothetical protein ACXAC7_13450 [Candidatus Hodarchaeales archaeon]|jgi:hypothetical protein